jgi:hypothetical protein
VWSETSQRYVRDTKDSWIEKKDDWIRMIEGKTFPLIVSFKFIRKSKHKFDYVNPLQTILDLMVKYEWIPDDNADIILPVFEPYEYNKEEPGVYINVLN